MGLPFGDVVPDDPLPLDKINGNINYLDAQREAFAKNLAGTGSNQGASLIGLMDLLNLFSSTNVEGALAELFEKSLTRQVYASALNWLALAETGYGYINYVRLNKRPIGSPQDAENFGFLFNFLNESSMYYSRSILQIYITQSISMYNAGSSGYGGNRITGIYIRTPGVSNGVIANNSWTRIGIASSGDNVTITSVPAVAEE